MGFRVVNGTSIIEMLCYVALIAISSTKKISLRVVMPPYITRIIDPKSTHI
jgi:hypothetical protein